MTTTLHAPHEEPTLRVRAAPSQTISMHTVATASMAVIKDDIAHFTMLTGNMVLSSRNGNTEEMQNFANTANQDIVHIHAAAEAARGHLSELEHKQLDILLSDLDRGYRSAIRDAGLEEAPPVIIKEAARQLLSGVIEATFVDPSVIPTYTHSGLTAQIQRSIEEMPIWQGSNRPSILEESKIDAFLLAEKLARINAKLVTSSFDQIRPQTGTLQAAIRTPTSTAMVPYVSPDAPKHPEFILGDAVTGANSTEPMDKERANRLLRKINPDKADYDAPTLNAAPEQKKE